MRERKRGYFFIILLVLIFFYTSSKITNAKNQDTIEVSFTLVEVRYELEKANIATSRFLLDITFSGESPPQSLTIETRDISLSQRLLTLWDRIDVVETYGPWKKISEDSFRLESALSNQIFFDFDFEIPKNIWPNEVFSENLSFIISLETEQNITNTNIELFVYSNLSCLTTVSTVLI